MSTPPNYTPRIRLQYTKKLLEHAQHQNPYLIVLRKAIVDITCTVCANIVNLLLLITREWKYLFNVEPGDNLENLSDL